MLAADAGAKLDQWKKDAKAGVNSADAKLESYRASAEKKIESGLATAQKDGKAAVDSFDKNVQEVSCCPEFPWGERVKR